jgi:hypothetical protein
MPFWLFCIGWAILSYLIVVILADIGLLPGMWVSHVEVQQSVAKPNRNRSASVEEMIPIPRGNKGMKPGYYMLNTEGSGIEGVPKYIYLGPAAPGME